MAVPIAPVPTAAVSSNSKLIEIVPIAPVAVATPLLAPKLKLALVKVPTEPLAVMPTLGLSLMS